MDFIEKKESVHESLNPLLERTKEYSSEERQTLGKSVVLSAEIVKASKEKPFPNEPGNEYWDKSKTEYFKTFRNENGTKGEWSKEERERRTQTLSKGVEVFRDEGLTFYKVKKGDTLFNIRKKLSEIDEFSYLGRDEYKIPGKAWVRNIRSFNILPRDMKEGMYVPIPLDSNNRKINYRQFANYCYEAVQDMKGHEKYGATITELLKTVSENELIEAMIAYAKCESCESTDQAIGSVTYHRWEANGHNAFSFSMFHVLMTQGSPGLNARRNLGLTEGQTFHPKNAAKLFLAFWIEKKGGSSKLKTYFPLRESNYSVCTRVYNGGIRGYTSKLKENHEYAKDRIRNKHQRIEILESTETSITLAEGNNKLTLYRVRDGGVRYLTTKTNEVKYVSFSSESDFHSNVFPKILDEAFGKGRDKIPKISDEIYSDLDLKPVSKENAQESKEKATTKIKLTSCTDTQAVLTSDDGQNELVIYRLKDGGINYQINGGSIKKRTFKSEGSFHSTVMKSILNEAFGEKRELIPQISKDIYKTMKLKTN